MPRVVEVLLVLTVALRLRLLPLLLPELAVLAFQLLIGRVLAQHLLGIHMKRL